MTDEPGVVQRFSGCGYAVVRLFVRRFMLAMRLNVPRFFQGV